MILYPTETLYALGVNALDASELLKLYELKERDIQKRASWLVRTQEDIKKYAELPVLGERIAEAFLPGSLTLVLKAHAHVESEFIAGDRTIGFRISSDPLAQEIIARFMEAHDAPLTCTSANISGSSTLSTVDEILQQFGPHAHLVTQIVDGGQRKGLASTIVRVIGSEMTLLREGKLTESAILLKLGI